MVPLLFILAMTLSFILRRGWLGSQPTVHGGLAYRNLRNRLDLDVRPRPSPDPSLYSQISAVVAVHPNQPIDYEGFPPIPSEEPDRFYQPGARDVFVDASAGDDRWKTVVAAILSAYRNKLDDWQVLEYNIKSVPFREHVNNVLAHLNVIGITYNVRSVFLDLVRHSSDYNAIKWGILIGEVRELEPHEIKDLVLMARHSEFTLPVCHALSRKTGWYQNYYHHLLDLLPVTEGVGLMYVVKHVLDEPLFQYQTRAHRDAVFYAMQHGSIARYPLALDIVDRENFVDLFAEGTTDHPLAFALLELLDALIWGEEPPGHLPNHPRGVELIDRYFDLIASLPDSIETLGALRSIYIMLGYETIVWQEREMLRERAISMLLERLSRETLESAIRDGHRQDIVLLLIMEGELTDLTYLALEEFRNRPTPLAADTLGTMGTPEHLEEMLRALPDHSEISERSKFARDTMISATFHERSLFYASIIRHIGRLGTSEAIERIKEAARDVHPMVRAAGMTGMRSLQQWTLDAESRELVRFCLGDPVPLVRDEAVSTAAYHTLHASLRRPGVGVTAPEAGIALN